MSVDVLLKVDGLSKKFCKDLKTSLRYGVSDMVAEVLGKEKTINCALKSFGL
jgi:lipopolysaccharide transport system ATP-binding protein